MIDQKYKDYLKSDDWAQIRIEIITKRKVCERCGSKNKLQVHHKHYKNIFHEKPADLELLCGICHQKEHNIKKKPKQHLTKKQKKKAMRDTARLKKLKARRKDEKNYQRFNLKYQ